VREQPGTTWEVVIKTGAITGATRRRASTSSPLSDPGLWAGPQLPGRRLGENGERDSRDRNSPRFDHTINSSVPVKPDRFGITDTSCWSKS